MGGPDPQHHQSEEAGLGGRDRDGDVFARHHRPEQPQEADLP
jgi:hypothetical protein